VIELLSLSRLTALPALLFLVCLPVYLWLPARHGSRVFLAASVAAIYVVAGPILGTGLLLINLAGWVVVEAVARLPRGRSVGFVVALGLLQLGYWVCFRLPVPVPYNTAGAGAVGTPVYYVLFSGIGLTFFRLITYCWARVREGAPPLSFLQYATFMLYFPQFRHGPIERAHSFHAQLSDARANWNSGRLQRGLLRILIGVVVLILARIVLAIWSHYLPPEFDRQQADLLAHPERLTVVQLLLLIHVPAILLYLFESSCAHIQLGVSLTFGVVGSENFRRPFLARDPYEFWHRWNITLFQWLRDYVYAPLRALHCPRPLGVLLVFIYCGLLHGLQWSCLCWGVWTGGTLVIYAGVRRLLGRRSRRDTNPPRRPLAGHLLTMLGRLATMHWFCLGVTIIIDPTFMGYRVLRQYVLVLLSLFGL